MTSDFARVRYGTATLRLPALESDAMCTGRTILVVDDEPMVLNVMRGILSAAGHQVLSAESAARALEIFNGQKNSIDLAILDVIMPGATGPEVADTLLLSRPDLRVLFTAGYADHPLVRSGVIARGFPLLSKPFLPADLRRAVQDIINGSPCSRRAAAE